MNSSTDKVAYFHNRLECRYSPQVMANMQDLKADKLAVLSDFIENCSEDPDTRTCAVTALVLGLWQMAPIQATRRFPSLLLASATPSTDLDPIDQLTDKLFFEPKFQKAAIQQDSPTQRGRIRTLI